MSDFEASEPEWFESTSAEFKDRQNHRLKGEQLTANTTYQLMIATMVNGELKFVERHPFNMRQIKETARHNHRFRGQVLDKDFLPITMVLKGKLTDGMWQGVGRKLMTFDPNDEDYPVLYSHGYFVPYEEPYSVEFASLPAVHELGPHPRHNYPVE